MTIEHVDAATPIDEITAILDADGALIIDRLFAGVVLEPVRRELAPVLDATEPGGGDFLGHSTKPIPGLLAKAPSFAVCVIDPLLLAIADHVLLPACRRYQLQITTAQEVGGRQGPSTTPR
jgi:hypothetical protein